MAPIGHIKLGPYNDIRPYILQEIRGFGPSNANPFAAPSGGNQGFNDLEGWAEWTMQDWQAGINQRDAEAGGLRFAVGDSRVPGQLMCGPIVVPTPRQSNDGTLGLNSPGTTSELEIGPTGADGTAIALYYDNPAGAVSVWVAAHLYCNLPEGVTLTMTAYTDSAGSISTQLNDYASGLPWSHARAPGTNTTPAMRMERLVQAGYGGIAQTNASGQGWLVITPSGGNIRIGRVANTEAGHTCKLYNGSWGATQSAPEVAAYIHFVYSGTYNAGDIEEFETWRMPTVASGEGSANPAPSCLVAGGDGKAYLLHGSDWFEYDATKGAFVFAYEQPAEAGLTPENSSTTAFAFAGDTYYVDSNQQGLVSKALGLINTSFSASVVVTAAAHRGLLWVGLADGTIAYTGDYLKVPTWDTVPTNAGKVIALCGVGDRMYVATGDGIAYIAPGDFIIPLMNVSLPVPSWWSYGEVGTGKIRMLNFEDSLWCILDGDVYRIDQGHTIVPMSPVRNSDHEEYAGQTPVALAKSQSYLYLLTADLTNSTGGFVFSFQPEGWHCIAYVPLDGEQDNTSLLFDQSNEVLFVRGFYQTYIIPQRASPTNAYFDTIALSTGEAWFETPPFFGSVRRIQKDFESVYLDTDGVAEGGGDVDVKVYYKERSGGTASTSGTGAWSAWALLGTASTGDETELRFSNYASNRIARRSIRLGFLLRQNTRNGAPLRVNAISTKYIPMVNDRDKWTLNIEVPPQLKALNGEWLIHPTDATATTHTQAEAITHLESCVDSVVPVIFEDTDGTRYEVKVTAKTRQIERFDVDASGNKIQSFIYSLAIEQVNDDPYVA